MKVVTLIVSVIVLLLPLKHTTLLIYCRTPRAPKTKDRTSYANCEDDILYGNEVNIVIHNEIYNTSIPKAQHKDSAKTKQYAL